MIDLNQYKGTFAWVDEIIKELEETREALEWAFDDLCAHAGELHPGLGREWCTHCNSWVYPSDKEMYKKIKLLIRGEE